MPNWFIRWMFNRHRDIFSYFNGQRVVKGDPLVLWRALHQHEDYAESDFKLLKAPALRDQIIAKLAGVVRQVFAVKVPDEGGLTEMECLDLLQSFILYAGLQKKSTGQTQTSPSTADQEYSDDSINAPNMNDDSGSI